MAKKYNNAYKVPNDKANEIRGLNNNDLIIRVSSEYQNWQAVLRQKKMDAVIKNLKDQIKEHVDLMKEDTAYQEAEAEWKQRKEELVTEEHARLKEELKNAVEPYNEDIKSFECLFKLGMEELDERKTMGVFGEDGQRL